MGPQKWGHDTPHMKDPVEEYHIVGPSIAAQTSVHDHIIFHFDKYGLSKNKVTRGQKVYCFVAISRACYYIFFKYFLWQMYYRKYGTYELLDGFGLLSIANYESLVGQSKNILTN